MAEQQSTPSIEPAAEQQAPNALEDRRGALRAALMRSLRITLVLLALAIAGISVAVALNLDAGDLPFEYDGFD